MANDRVTTISDAVHKVQLALFDGIQDEAKLFAAGSLMSRSDYEDIVTERSLTRICGYPLCPNVLPTERPRKGHYRISLKEHKVYDLHETYKYCSSKCLINSQVFVGSLQDERCSDMNLVKLNEILSLFKNLSLESEEEMGENGDMGLSKLKIDEKSNIKGVKVPMEEWVGPSNAIEGYVPQRDRKTKPLLAKAKTKDCVSGGADMNKQNGTAQKKVDSDFDVVPNKDIGGPRMAPTNEKCSKVNHSSTSTPLFNEMDFMSAIITDDEYIVSKLDGAIKPDVAQKDSKPKMSVSNKGKDPVFSDMDFVCTGIIEDEYNVWKSAPSLAVSKTHAIHREFAQNQAVGEAAKLLKLSEEYNNPAKNDLQSSKEIIVAGTGIATNESSSIVINSHESEGDGSCSSVYVSNETCYEQAAQSSHTTIKSSLRTSRSQKAARSVTWADNKYNGPDGGNLCEVKEFNDAKEVPRTVTWSKAGDDDFERFALAEACAAALTEAAEAVSSGETDVTDAVSEAGIIVLPKTQQADEGEDLIEDDPLKETTSLKWPEKPGNTTSDIESDESWFDVPPTGFSLTLSPFATMWNALFSWMTSSSLAYIYGRDESFHEEYMSVNGREYPEKVVLPDGRSSEIKQTLDGCFARAMPEVVAVLKLSTPVSKLEQELLCLINTMSFMEALPPFNQKQWEVITLLFVDALSVCRIPGITPYLMSRRILIPKVLNGAHITVEEYEIMKELVIPLGRVPQFSMQSGG